MEDYRTTGEVCSLLGRDYETIMSLVHRYRSILSLQRKGSKLLWSPAAIEFMRKLADDRVPRFGMRQTAEARSYEAALKALKRQISEYKRLKDELERVHQELSENPPSVAAVIHTLPNPDWSLVKPIHAIVGPTDRGNFRAYLVDVDLWAEGQTRKEALLELRHVILSTYLDPESVNSGVWKLLKPHIVAASRE